MRSNNVGYNTKDAVQILSVLWQTYQSGGIKMIDRLMKYEKAWAEFVKYAEDRSDGFWDKADKEFYDDYYSKLMNPYQVDGLLIEFLDEQKVCLFIIPVLGLQPKLRWCYKIPHADNEIGEVFTGDWVDSRQQATEEGIIKAFELLERRKEYERDKI